MLTVTVLVGLLAFVSAHGGNMMGGTFGQGMYGNMGNMGHIGQMSQMGQNNNGMNQLMRLLGMGGSMGMGGNMGGNTGGHTGGHTGMGGNTGGRGGQQQGMMGGMMLLLIQNLLQGRNGQGNQGNQMSQEEMEDVEKLMKKKMMMEMADMIMMHMEFKEEQEEFEKAMEAMCFLVNATYNGYEKNGTEVWNHTTESSMIELGAKLERMSDKEKMDFAVDMMLNNKDKYGEIFLRFATWACMKADSYRKAYMEMEKMEKGHE